MYFLYIFHDAGTRGRKALNLAVRATNPAISPEEVLP